MVSNALVRKAHEALRKEVGSKMSEAMLGILDDEEAEPKRSSGVALPVWMWEQIEAIAKRRGRSRNRIIFLLLKNGLELVSREEKIAEPDKGGPTKRKGH
jgi:hypothetical protein